MQTDDNQQSVSAVVSELTSPDNIVDEGLVGTSKKKRTRSAQRPFPQVTLEEALELANAIHAHAAGHDVRRLTLFEKLDRSPDSSAGRRLVTNSARYGITKGSYNAEYISLHPEGKLASDPEGHDGKRLQARFRLGVEGFAVFKSLYLKYKGNRLPSDEIMRDDLRTLGVAESDLASAAIIFVGNLNFLGLLRTIAGARRVIPIEQLLEETPVGSSEVSARETFTLPDRNQPTAGARIDFGKTCFFVAPIGDEGTELRKHSDMVLTALVEPALAQTGLKVVRADQITKPGMISAQTLDYILRSRLVVADLSFQNPNVFYELALRHIIGLPIVHLIRVGDEIPFDVANFRTIIFNTSDIYELVAQLETYKAQIANYAREALSDPDSNVANPVRTFFPTLRVELPS
jgi:hypothetical protein